DDLLAADRAIAPAEGDPIHLGLLADLHRLGLVGLARQLGTGRPADRPLLRLPDFFRLAPEPVADEHPRQHHERNAGKDRPTDAVAPWPCSEVRRHRHLLGRTTMAAAMRR